MNAEEVYKKVIEAIIDRWEYTNFHGCNLKKCILNPSIRMSLKDTFNNNELIEMWCVFIEDPETNKGYRIVYNDEINEYGLAVENNAKFGFGFAFIGYYGDFMNTFENM